MRNGEREDAERTAASQATPSLIHVVPAAVEGAGRGVRAWHTEVARRWSVRGTPWLGSRRGVVITSRSDRVPLLSRRHTPAEKQNGTDSCRPTDRPTLPPLLPHPPPSFDNPLAPFSLPTLSSLADSLAISALTKCFRPGRYVIEQREQREL